MLGVLFLKNRGTLFIFLAFVFSLGSQVKAGGFNGGGGRVVVCSDSTGEVESVELLDIFEAKAIWGLKIPISAEAMEEQLNRALRKIGVSKDFKEAVENIRQIVQFLPKGVVLKDTGDSGEIFEVAGNCKLQQLATYFNDKKLLVNQDLFDALSPMHRAAFYLHEAIYLWERNWSAVNSRRARHIVGEVMSDRDVFKQAPLIDQEALPKDGLMKCHTPKTKENENDFRWTEFFAYKVDGKYQLDFRVIANESKLTQTVIKTKYSDFSQFEKSGVLRNTVSSFEGDDLVWVQPISSPTGEAKFTIIIDSGWDPNDPNRGSPSTELICR